MNQPDIILVGDSIRLSYQPHVQAVLDDQRVWGPPENCESTRFLLMNLDRLVLDGIKSPSVVHLNAGAHDLRRWPEGDFAVQVELDEYVVNMAAIVERLVDHEMVSEVHLATTTPVIDKRHETGRWGRRHDADVLAYNQRLVGVAATYQLAVNDLYSVVASCEFDAISDDGIHLTPRGAEYAGNAVASFLSAATAG